MIRVGMGVMGPGFFDLPEGVKLYCSVCGKAIYGKNDKIKMFFSEDKGGFRLGLDCNSCGSIGVDPVVLKPE